MLFRCVAIVAAALPTTMSLPTYAIPKSFHQLQTDDTCVFPEAFEIQNFTIWTPAPGNSDNTPVLNFGYFDQSTNLQTSCHYNATSRNVAQPQLTPRYACNNGVVEFIWQNGTLTVIEAACPGDAGSTPWEASGTAEPVLNCVATTCNSTYGDGSMCTAVDSDLQANFTSLEPSPQ